MPTPPSEDDDLIADAVCGVEYYLYDVVEDTGIPATIASIKVGESSHLRVSTGAAY